VKELAASNVFVLIIRIDSHNPPIIGRSICIEFLIGSKYEGLKRSK